MELARAAFDEQYKRLNPEQREAVDALAGPVMVIAGPGTGKTEVLAMRIANILDKKKAKPERILALTFTESGAVSMRRRLAELIGKDAYRLEISTFHGFANRIIRDYPDYFPAIIGSSSITEIDQVSILRTIIDTLPLKELRPFNERYHYLRNILSAINELKQQGVTPASFAKIAKEEKEFFYANPDLINASGKYEGKMKTKYISAANHVARNIELADVYAEYQKALAVAKQYDYSDMIMYVALALEKDEEMRRVLQDSYDYFLVDEHQDTNDAQNKMIELVAGDGGEGGGGVPNLFVVGDEKQAIFRFQGASLENFHYFNKRYKGVKLISLRNNYRSTQAILNAAQGVSPRETELVAQTRHFAQEKGARGKAGSVEEPPAHFAVLPSPDAEYFFIARKIKELIAGGVAPESVAVLYRDNKDAAPLARVLEKESIPFAIESDQDVMGDDEIKKLIRILRAIQHFGSDAALVDALHMDLLGLAPLDLYKITVSAHRERVRVYDFLRSPALVEKCGVSDEARAAIATIARNFSNWKRAAENRGAVEAFEIIVRESGFLAALLRHPSATEKLTKLHALFDLLKSLVERNRNYTLNDFFAYLDLIQEHGVSVKGRDAGGLPGRVRLMTAHRSKGQEFDYVFIINAVDRKWGSRFHRETIKLPNRIYRVLEGAEEAFGAGDEAGDDGESAASELDTDERNIFYVALTRARKEVFVTASKTDRDGKECLPTKFIIELREDLLTPYDVTSYEKEFSGRREREFDAPAAKMPELEDKKFLRELFDAEGLSVTALNNYLECPWRYFYVNLIRVPEAPNKHLSFGNAIHAALKAYFDVAAEAATDGGGDLPAAKEYLLRKFEDALAREPIKANEYEEALEKGRTALPAFYDQYHAQWSADALAAPHVALNEWKVEGVVLKDGTPLKGKLDRVEFLVSTGGAPAPGSAPMVRVTDFKTGGTKTRNEIEGNTKNSDGNYKRQLVFYKLLLDKEAEYAMQSGVIQFIEPDDRDKFHREEFTITTAEVVALEQEVERVADEIRNLKFWNAPCDDEKCEYCELRRGWLSAAA
jgi:DNA helicase-2/ATP-dependent DNA helicase PcrA